MSPKAFRFDTFCLTFKDFFLDGRDAGGLLSFAISYQYHTQCKQMCLRCPDLLEQSSEKNMSCWCLIHGTNKCTRVPLWRTNEEWFIYTGWFVLYSLRPGIVLSNLIRVRSAVMIQVNHWSWFSWSLNANLEAIIDPKDFVGIDFNAEREQLESRWQCSTFVTCSRKRQINQRLVTLLGRQNWTTCAWYVIVSI